MTTAMTPADFLDALDDAGGEFTHAFVRGRERVPFGGPIEVERAIHQAPDGWSVEPAVEWTVRPAGDPAYARQQGLMALWEGDPAFRSAVDDAWIEREAAGWADEDAGRHDREVPAGAVPDMGIPF